MSRRKDPPLSGVVLVDKPSGMTSHDIVAWVRRTLGMRRVGHAGTLDPLATGLLPCFFGPATRLIQYLHAWPKTYLGVIALGAESATGDLEGLDDLPRVVPPHPPEPVLRRAREKLLGTYPQTPPVYSAKKIGGIPAHRLARQGHAPILAPSTITVHAFRLSPRPEGRLAFAAKVSSGTYIRSLARDLGRLVGTGAYLEFLRRSAIGPLVSREAVTPQRDLGRDELLTHCLSPTQVPLPLSRIELDAASLEFFRAGRKVEAPSCRSLPQGALAILTPEGQLAGIGECGSDAMIQPRIVLPPPDI